MGNDSGIETVNPDRFNQRFVSPPSAFIVTSPSGESRRLDGKPLSAYDIALLRGKKPMPDVYHDRDKSSTRAV